jgi:hypothetical protein
MNQEETTNYTQPKPIGTIGEITDSQLTPEERQAAWEQSMEYVRNQEPLNRVYETSDFAQGIARGRRTERIIILNLLSEEIKRVSEPMMVDKEYLDGISAAIHIVQKLSDAN